LYSVVRFPGNPHNQALHRRGRPGVGAFGTRAIQPGGSAEALGPIYFIGGLPASWSFWFKASRFRWSTAGCTK
jgi:hypothetical protein